MVKKRRDRKQASQKELPHVVYDTDGDVLASFRRRMDAIEFLKSSVSSLCVCDGDMLEAYRRDDGKVVDVNDASFNSYVAKIVLTRTRL